MAVTSKVVAQTGSAVSLGAKGTFARWVLFANNAAANMAVADANVSLTQGALLQSNGGTFFLPPMPNGCHYDLGQWYGIGTNTQNLAIVWDAMN